MWYTAAESSISRVMRLSLARVQLRFDKQLHALYLIALPSHKIDKVDKPNRLKGRQAKSRPMMVEMRDGSGWEKAVRGTYSDF